MDGPYPFVLVRAKFKFFLRWRLLPNFNDDRCTDSYFHVTSVTYIRPNCEMRRRSRGTVVDTLALPHSLPAKVEPSQQPVFLRVFFFFL